MSEYYNPERTRNLYQPAAAAPFKLSRSKIELFLECPRCFYLDRRLGVGRPPGFPFNLNSAVDELLKREFDGYRARGEKHPLIERFGIEAVPAPHAELEKWRTNFTGIRYHHAATNLLIFGAIDDLWQDPAGNYIVVDYKATSKIEPITVLDKPWQDGYKRQMEIYQWLLRQNGYPVAATGYFVYCNADRGRGSFEARLEFEINLIPYTGRDAWIEPTIHDLHECLNRREIPFPSPDCDYCAYVQAVGKNTG